MLNHLLNHQNFKPNDPEFQSAFARYHRVLSQAITTCFRKLSECCRKLSQSAFASYHRVLSQAITEYFRKLASYHKVISQVITECCRKLSQSAFASAQKCCRNAGNAISDTQISNISGGHVPHSPYIDAPYGGYVYTPLGEGGILRTRP